MDGRRRELAALPHATLVECVQVALERLYRIQTEPADRKRAAAEAGWALEAIIHKGAASVEDATANVEEPPLEPPLRLAEFVQAGGLPPSPGRRRWWRHQ